MIESITISKQISNHSLFLLNIHFDALQPFVHHFTIKSKQSHILFHCLLLLLLLCAFIHHSLQLLKKHTIPQRRCTRLRSFLRLENTIFRRDSGSLRLFDPPQLKIALTFFKHHQLIPLLIMIETLLLQFLLQRILQFLILHWLLTYCHLLSPLQHLTLHTMEWISNIRFTQIIELTKIYCQIFRMVTFSLRIMHAKIFYRKIDSITNKMYSMKLLTILSSFKFL